MADSHQRKLNPFGAEPQLILLERGEKATEFNVEVHSRRHVSWWSDETSTATLVEVAEQGRATIHPLEKGLERAEVHLQSDASLDRRDLSKLFFPMSVQKNGNARLPSLVTRHLDLNKERVFELVVFACEEVISLIHVDIFESEQADLRSRVDFD